MEPTRRSDRILDEWDAVTARARPATAAPRRHGVRSLVTATVLAGAGVALVAFVVLAGGLGGPAPDGVGATPVPPGSTVTPATTPPATPPASVEAASRPTTNVPSSKPSPTASSGPAEVAACDPVLLRARILGWDGAAGQRTATVELTNRAPAACTVPRLMTPRLVDAADTVLIDGTPPSTARSIVVGPGGVLTTLVQAGNYCGPAPTAPVSVAFVFDTFTLVADPAKVSDLSVPPCLGAPGSAGDIGMQPWRARS